MNKHTPLHPVPPCPNHPDSNMVRAHVEEDVFGNLRLTRYVCAAGCSTHLSWQFHRINDNVFAYGVGRCEDPKVLEAFRQVRYSNKTDALVLGLVTPAIFLVAFAVFEWDALPPIHRRYECRGVLKG